MPIYEYYCAVCRGRFSHLAKRINTPAPACPRCGNAEVERLVSVVHTIHNNDHHQDQLKADTTSIDSQNPAEIAQFLKNSGRLEDTAGVYGSKTYRELLDRRAEGAEDHDLADLVDDLAAEMQSPVMGDATGALLFSDKMENRIAAEGPPETQEQPDGYKSDDKRHDAQKTVKRRADDLGWA